MTRPDIAATLRGRPSATALVEAALAAIERHADLNAIAAVDADAALAEAAARDRDGPTGPLHGIPVTVKDLFATEVLPTEAGTRAPLPPLGAGDAAAVARLRAAGAVILAKANCHEIALGLTGENAWTGDVRNPHDPTRQSGGSSSGSGAAVAARIGLASLGTDTGGSIRVPAALCGLVGFKPSYGLVPLGGCLPLSPSADHAGPLARSVADARLLTEVLAGVTLPVGQVDSPRFGVPVAWLDGRLSRDARAAFEALIARLTAAGATIVEVVPTDIDETLPAYTPLVRAEAARVHRAALDAQPEGFSDGVRAGLLEGQALTAGAYLEALERRERVRAGMAALFDEGRIDALLVPTTPDVAPVRGTTNVELESGTTPQRSAQLALTAPFNLAGVPALSLPFAAVGALPLGVQVVGSWGADARVLDVAGWVEGVIDSTSSS